MNLFKPSLQINPIDKLYRVKLVFKFDLDALIDDHLDRQQKKEKRVREIGRFWATDFGKCKRQVYYSFTNPKEFEASKRKIFSVGNIIHEFLQAVLKEREGELFKLVWNERYMTITDVETNLIITGRIDTLLQHADESFIVEFKTENERAFSMRKTPLLSHKSQFNLYLRSQRLSYGYIVYINKSDMSLKIFRVDFDEEVFQRCMRDARDLFWHLQHSNLPMKKPSAFWECGYCKYKEECDKNDNPALHAKLFPNKE